MLNRIKETYDYIFAGAGLAGLSLLYYVINNPSLSNKQILVIDSDKKSSNDRTWCFWEKEIEFYEQLVSARWNTLKFKSTSVNKIFALKDYQYKLIKSIDYYNFIISKALNYNVEIRTENILSMEEIGSFISVNTDYGKYYSKYVFNSTNLFNPTMSHSNTLLQHFEGWVIKVDNNYFDKNVATLMDFNLSQEKGVAFMYVLPTKSNEALIEYTLFSNHLLNKEEYSYHLRHYIKEKLGIEKYKIIHNEYGVIPMSCANFKSSLRKNCNIINIGTAGGHTKPSTGYTFKFVQKKCKQIAERLSKNQSPILEKSFRDKMFRWYDLTLLDVLINNKANGERIFSALFKKNDPERVLAFLAEESTHIDEFKIRNSVPIGPFISSGFKILFSHNFSLK
jgi:lycopene beta-cyclase